MQHKASVQSYAPKASNPLVVAVCYYKFKVDCFVNLPISGNTSCANPHVMMPFSDDFHLITTQVFATITLA